MAKKKKEAEVKATVGQYAILIAPAITEKASTAESLKSGVGRNRLVLKVDRRATKPEIREAVERVFNVKVYSVNTVNYMGKEKRTTSVIGRRAAFKKAYITLQEGHSIQVVEGL